jgi:hypothetical protein
MHISSIPYLIYLNHETFSHYNAWPIHISKLHGISTTDTDGWIMLNILCFDCGGMYQLPYGVPNPTSKCPKCDGK